jgi:hypothetical protein
MAENESLDLTSPRAQRWNAVRDAAQKGASSEQVGSITRKTFLKAIRKVVGQFEEYGVTTSDFLGKRGSPRDLKNLVSQTKCHSYPDAPPSECLYRWGHAILDTVFDQIGLELGGSEVFPSYFDTHSLFGEVRAELRGDLETVAVRLTDDPHWKPVVRVRKGEAKVDPTASQMRVSLIGGPR